MIVAVNNLIVYAEELSAISFFKGAGQIEVRFLSGVCEADWCILNMCGLSIVFSAFRTLLCVQQGSAGVGTPAVLLSHLPVGAEAPVLRV